MFQKEALVSNIPDKERGTTRIVVEWPDGGYSEHNDGKWSTRWKDGEMVEVVNGSDHALACDAVSLRTRTKGHRGKDEVIYI